MTLEIPPKKEDLQPELFSVEQVNRMVEEGQIIEADFVTEFQKFKPDRVIPSTHDWSYYEFNDEDINIDNFARDFLKVIQTMDSIEHIIEQANKYVVEKIQWTGKEGSRNIGELVRLGRGSCTSKSVLLAYLLYRLDLEAYLIPGYARNVSIGGLTELRKRNTAYKRGSYPDNLFNMPLDPKDKPIYKDVGHAWVGVKVKGEMIYVDPTTGLVSVNDSEREIFSKNYKTLPLGDPEGGGIEILIDEQRNAIDLDFKEPIQRVRIKISKPIEAGDRSVILAGPEDTDIELLVPVKGLEVISHSKV